MDMDNDQGQEIDLGTMSQLVDAARGGSTAAHSEICRQVQTHLARMAAKHLDGALRRKLNPSDIVQATMARMVQGFGDFRGSSSKEFYGWLNAILVNEVHCTRRNLQRQKRDVRRETELGSKVIQDVAQAASALPEQRLIENEALETFRDVITRLPPDYAQVIELRSLQELPFEEIAVQMGRTTNAVSKLWGRALVRLQEELARADESILE